MSASARVPAPRGGLAPAKLAHIVLKTNRLEEMAEWYRRFLDAGTMFANDRIVFLTYDEEHHRIALIRRPNLSPPAPDAAGLDHFAFAFADFAGLARAYERLKAEGVMPDWTVNHGTTTSLYYRDPDGNRVELQVDNFASVAELNDWFATGAFDVNPIGVEFDMDRLLARFRAGAAEREILRPASR